VASFCELGSLLEAGKGWKYDRRSRHRGGGRIFFRRGVLHSEMT